jgi:hypothetical protein
MHAHQSSNLRLIAEGLRISAGILLQQARLRSVEERNSFLSGVGGQRCWGANKQLHLEQV